MAKPSWRRIVRALLGIAAVVFAVVVYRAIRVRQPAAPTAGRSVRTDPAAVAESVRGESFVARGTVQDFKVEYDRLLTYEDGTLRFEKVTVRVPQRAGRDFTVSGARATVTNQQNDLAIEGDVRLMTSDGLTATADRATFQKADGVLRIPGPLAFEKERLVGRGVGATYDRATDVLTLLQDASVQIGADAETGRDALEIRSESAVFARADRYMRFDKTVRVLRDATTIEADGALAHLAADADRLELLELTGHTRLRTAGTPPGGLEGMEARDMNLSYAPDGRTLQRAILAGRSTLLVAGPAGSPSRRLSAELIDVGVGSDGQTVTSLTANDAVELFLPGDRANPTTRRVRSSRLEGAGRNGQALSAVRFAENVEFSEMSAATASTAALERYARARTLEATMQPGLGAINVATFGGGVTFRDGETDATAPDAVYDLLNGSLSLSSAAGTTVRVTDSQVDIEARSVALGVDSRALTAEGDVRSSFKPSRSAGGGAAARKRPSLLRQDQPVNVTAKQLAYDPGAGTATYTGEARLWQGDTAVQAGSIMLDDRRGNLVATSNVRSVWQFDDTNPKTKATERKATIATADELNYDESRRCATYTRNARMVGPEGDLRSSRMELFLSPTGTALDKLEAYEAVTLRSEGRASSGRRLTYHASDARYVMVGTPVRVLEQLPSECRETIGRTLTFYRSTDTVLVDGNERDRTRTHSGSTCAASPPGD